VARTDGKIYGRMSATWVETVTRDLYASDQAGQVAEIAT
jgi:hypothetical protein